MDSLTQIRLTRDLIDIDSTTAAKSRPASSSPRRSRGLGWTVVEQPVVDGRFNVVAHLGDPVVVLSTHFDCVPPFFREPRTGRAPLRARRRAMPRARWSRRSRRPSGSAPRASARVGLLFVVGEERGSEGATAANTARRSGRAFLINGEPTDNRLATATRGVYRVRLRATGTAAHSSLPHLGESAIDKLVDAIVALRRVDWPADP